MACVVKGCNSHPSDIKFNRALSFHRFPVDPVLKTKWIKNIKRPDWAPSKYSRVCGLHFKESYFVVGAKRKFLHSNAIPTIFPYRPTNMQQVKQSDQASSSSEPSNKKKKFDDGSDCDEDNSDIEEEYDDWAEECARELRQMAPDQQIFAKRAITHILMEGRLGLLHKDSVQINNKIPDEQTTQDARNTSLDDLLVIRKGKSRSISMAVPQVVVPSGSSPSIVDMVGSLKAKMCPSRMKSKSLKKTGVQPSRKTADSISSSSFDNTGSSFAIASYNIATTVESSPLVYKTTDSLTPGLSSGVASCVIEALDSSSPFVVKEEPFEDINSDAQEIAASVASTPIHVKLEPSDGSSLPAYASEVAVRTSPALVKSEPNSPLSSPGFTVTIKNEKE